MAEYRHLDHPYHDDLVVHVPCGTILTPEIVPRHTCHPLNVAIVDRIRRGEVPDDSAPQMTTANPREHLEWTAAPDASDPDDPETWRKANNLPYGTARDASDSRSSGQGVEPQ